MKNIIINVDDLGLSDAVNQSVVELAEMGRISSTSYMVGGNISSEHQQALADRSIDIGLHLDFTGVFSSSMTSTLPILLAKSYAHLLNKKVIQEAVYRQFEEFSERFGHQPVFVDGHQHCHQFPMIRAALLDELNKRGTPDKPIATRITKPRIADRKAHIIYALGGKRWQQMCYQHLIPNNAGFAGVYGFDKNHSELLQLWSQWFAQCSNSDDDIDVIMCHPAVPSGVWSDEIKMAREIEHAVLTSQQFGDMMYEHKVGLCHWRSLQYAPKP